MIAQHEDFVPHMYLDSQSYVTVGFGRMMRNAAATAAIALIKVDVRPNRPATAAEKAAEWRTMQALSPAGTRINFAARHYARYRTMELTRAEGTRLLEDSLGDAIAILRANYPGFADFPEDAQVAMIDMAYNLGNRIHTVFVSFTRAINQRGGPDWREAAAQSNRPQLSAARNLEIRNLFLSARRAAEAARRGARR